MFSARAFLLYGPLYASNAPELRNGSKNFLDLLLGLEFLDFPLRLAELFFPACVCMFTHFIGRNR